MDQQTEVPASSPAVFDRTRELEVNIRRFGKKVTVRFPTDIELTAHNAGIKTYQRRGKPLDVEGVAEACLDLFHKIKISGDDLDADASQVLVGLLLREEFSEEPEADAANYKIALTVLGGIRTVHVLRKPTLKEENRYDKTCLSVGERRFNRVSLSYSFPAILGLYDELFVSAEGYPGEGAALLAAIPVTHKHAALRAVFEAVKTIDDEGDPVTFK